MKRIALSIVAAISLVGWTILTFFVTDWASRTRAVGEDGGVIPGTMMFLSMWLAAGIVAVVVFEETL